MTSSDSFSFIFIHKIKSSGRAFEVELLLLGSCQVDNQLGNQA